MKSISFFPIALLALIVGLFLFSCTTPTNLNSASNTEIYLVDRTSTQLAGNQGLVDSVGNPVTAGFYCNFPANIDSVQLELVSTNGSDSLLKTFTNFSTMKYTDTLWQTIVFGDTGTKTIKGVAYIKNYQPYSDSISVHIYGKPINRRPVLLVNGQTTIAQKGVCVLTVMAIDTDLAQKVSVSMLYGPKGSRLTDTTFIWTPDSNFAGIDSAVFVAQDNGYPVMYDTVRTIITVTGVSNTSGPKWKLKTVNLVGQPGNSIKMTLSDKFTYAQNDNLIFTLLSGPPAGDSISVSALDTAYFFMPGPGDTGVFNPQIVVKNTAGLSDTLTITLTLHAPGAIDTLPPMMKILSPSTDSSSVSSSSYPVKILCTDPSGVASVKCFIGAVSMPVTVADSTYTASVSGLKAGMMTTLAFIAADSSARSNKDTLFVHIKYDSTMADNAPPLISLVSPSKDTVIGADSIVVRVKCTDASGVASVVCSLKTNQTFAATKSTPTDSVYSATVKGLTAGAYSSITVTATDASPAHNAAAATVRIKYDNDKMPPSLRLLSPANTNDSAVVTGNATTVQVVCKDGSGVASVTYSMGAAAPQSMTKSLSADSIWSASVTGLAAGQFSTLNIVATDSSLAANKDTLIVHIKYDTTKADNTPPVITLISPSKDTAIAADSALVSVKCTDASGIATLVYTLGTQSFTATRSAPTDSIFNATVKGLTAGAYSTVTITATDASVAHNTATATVKIKYDNDKTGPTIERFDPAVDSQSVSASSYAVKVVCKDTSGVASVVLGLGTASFPGTKSSDSIWTATVTNLVSGAFNKITVTATDGSVSANVSTLNLSIKYDPTMTDNVPPSITLVGPSKDTIVTVDSFVVRVKCTDASGVASVIYTLGTQTFTATRSAPTDSIFSATVKGLSTAANPTVTITATDASTAANKGTKTVALSFAIAAKITTALASTTAVNTGSSTALTIVATGTPAPLYQWYFNGAVITTNSQSASYSKSWTAADAGTYKVIITNVAGQDSSKTVLSVNVAPVISPKLAATTAVNPGSTTALTIAATGTPAPTYQWYFNGTAITTNGTLASYSKTWASTDAGTYKVIASNSAGKDSSSTVLSVNVAPVISPKLAATTTVVSGSSTALTITATGTPTPTYQWYFNGTAISTNGTSASYSKTWATTDAGTYKVIASNAAGKDSSTTVLSVNVKATITTPLAATSSVASGSSTGLAITATGTPAPTYQWYFNGTAIATNGTSASYSKTWAFTDAGTYKVVATNSAGKDSSTTTLKVLGWERVVLAINDPDGSTPCAVMTSNGDIYMAYNSMALYCDKLAANTTTWVHTSSDPIEVYKGSFGGKFDIELSSDKTVPYVGYVDPPSGGDVVQYIGGTWTSVNANMQCSSSPSYGSTFSSFAIDGSNNVVFNYQSNGSYIFSGICDNMGAAVTEQIDIVDANVIQFNSSNNLIWAYCNLVSKWNPTGVPHFDLYNNAAIPDANGSTDQTTCTNIVLRFDNANTCYAFRTTGSGYPQVWRGNTSSWQTLGGGPLKNGNASDIRLVYGDDNNFYASYYDPDSTAIIIRQYDAANDKWNPFPAVTNGKLPMASYGSGYALIIKSGAVYIVSSYIGTSGNAIGTWCYKP